MDTPLSPLLLTDLFRSNVLKFVFKFICAWTFPSVIPLLNWQEVSFIWESRIRLTMEVFWLFIYQICTWKKEKKNYFSDLERQLDEMRRPYLVEMVELWKTMGMGYNKGERRNVQKKRISPMVGFFKEQFEDLIKNDQKNLRDLTKEIERHCKERLELRRTLNITGKCITYYFCHFGLDI